ncbi:Rhodanese-like_domain-containing protein [Hexamita inflata]|uniref:Rhodanese-like domain-containing protein n=1 Tax=Hexamita inflata TaxID=28002 RepID=A0AA86UUD5_9EUKA|nr:Rhodanese-like domain-containing protein [Hexamita inflata]
MQSFSSGWDDDDNFTPLSSYYSDSQTQLTEDPITLSPKKITSNKISKQQRFHYVPKIQPSSISSFIAQSNMASRQTRLELVDCRWPYEFAGGSIQGSRNVCSGLDLQSLVLNRELDDSVSVVFYCEYSQVRSVKLAKLFARLCPNREYFVLDGGYHAFFGQFPHLTTTGRYVAERDDELLSDLYSNCGTYDMKMPQTVGLDFK